MQCRTFCVVDMTEKYTQNSGYWPASQLCPMYERCKWKNRILQIVSNLGLKVLKGREGARGQTHKIERLDLEWYIFLLAIFVSVFGGTPCVPKTIIYWRILKHLDCN